MTSLSYGSFQVAYNKLQKMLSDKWDFIHMQAEEQVRWVADDVLGTWWHHQMEAFSMLLALCAGNSPVTGEFPLQRPVTRSFDVFFDLCLNQWLSKQLRRQCVETP